MKQKLEKDSHCFQSHQKKNLLKQKKKNVENTKQKKNVDCEEISERKWQLKTQEKTTVSLNKG